MALHKPITHSISTRVKNYCPNEEDEDILEVEIPCLIGAKIIVTTNLWIDIVNFVENFIYNPITTPISPPTYVLMKVTSLVSRDGFSNLSISYE